MQIARFFWWVCFFVFALLLQQHISSVDVLSAGVLLALQQKNRFEIFWVILISTLLQEGPGTLPFGMAPLWYVGHIGLFYFGRRVLVPNSLSFAFFICASLSLYKANLLWLMCTLTDIPVDYVFLFEGSVKQFILTPVLWRVIYLLRLKEVRYAHRS